MSQSEEKLYEGEMPYEEAIKTFLNGLNTTPDVSDPNPQPTQAPAPQEDPASAPAAEAAPSEPEPEDKLLVRLVQREAALERRKRAIEEQAQKLKEMESKLQDFTYWQEDFKADPVGFIRAHLPDMNLASLAEQVWYGQNPSKAPVPHQAMMEARAARAEAIKARRGVAQAPQPSAGEETTEEGDDDSGLNRYIGALRTYTTKVDASEYPLVARFAKRNADRAHQALFAHAQRVAQETEGNRVLTPAEAAAELEKELRELQLTDEPATGSSQAPVTQQTAQTQPTSIRNSHSQVQPDRQPVNELSDEHLRLKAFMAMGYDEATAKRLAAS